MNQTPEYIFYEIKDIWDQIKLSVDSLILILLLTGHLFCLNLPRYPKLSKLWLFLVVSFKSSHAISKFEQFFCVFLKEGICLTWCQAKIQSLFMKLYIAMFFMLLKTSSKKSVPKQWPFWLPIAIIHVILARYIHYTYISKSKNS